MASKYRKCKICRERKPVTGGFINGLDFVCSTDHLADLGLMRAAKQKAKEQQQKAKQQKAETRAKKQALKPDGQLMAEAQKAVNGYVRERDRGLPCISCGRPEHEIEAEQGWKTGGAWDAGHFRSRGAAGHLRFNLWNIHRQCKSCNAGSAKYAHKAETTAKGYEQHLRQKIGDKRVEWLKNHNEITRFSRDYFQRIGRIFRARTRQLQRRA